MMQDSVSAMQEIQDTQDRITQNQAEEEKQYDLFCRQDYLKRGEYLRSYFTEAQAKLYEELQGKVEAVPDLDGITDPDNLMYDIMGGADVAAKVQEYKPVWQAKLDDYAKALK